MENYYRRPPPPWDEPPFETDFETWLVRYRIVRVREAILDLGHACNSYAAEDQRTDGAHMGRIAKRQRDVDAAVERYIDAKRPVESYPDHELATLDDLYRMLRGKLPDA